jgi:hypothetical protein
MKMYALYNFPNHLLIKMVCLTTKKRRKNTKYIFFYKDVTLSPSVWLGTSTGCVIVINLNINYEPRNISGKFYSLNY